MKNKPGSIPWILIGLFLLVMGLYFLIHPQETLLSVAWMFGLTMLVSGAADLAVYAARKWVYGLSGWFLADGIIDVVLGVVFLCNGWLAVEVLPYVLAVWAVGSGIVKCAGALVYRRGGMPFWGVQFGVGVVVLLFGVAVLLHPMIAVAAISAVIAILLITQGLMALMRGLFASFPNR